MERIDIASPSFDALCIGGINLDHKLKALAPLHAASSNPCVAVQSPGGVARNVAENLARLGLKVSLVGHLGRDVAAQSLLTALAALDVDVRHCVQSNSGATGSYTAILDPQGQMVMGMADMALTEQLSPQLLSPLLHTKAAIWLADMNLPEVSLAWLTEKALAQRQRLVVLAVSEPKMQRLPQDLRGIDTLVLNQGELVALATHQSWPAGTHEDCAAAFGLLQAAGLQRLVVTQGKSGVSFIEAGQAQSSHLKPELAQEHQVRDVSGAGDAFCAGLCASYLRYPQDALSLHVQRAMRLAVLTVQSEQSVNPAITPDLI